MTSDDVVILSQGRLVAEGTVAEVMRTTATQTIGEAFSKLSTAANCQRGASVVSAPPRTTLTAPAPPLAGFGPAAYLVCLKGILVREGLRFLNQRERFISSLVRPLLWLFIFAAGFRQVLGVSIIPPYKTYVLYEVYITPGLCGMILLFSGMQSSLSMVYDREMGNMRTLLVSPFPRWFLLVSKLLAGVTVSMAQVYVFLGIAWFWGVRPPPTGYLFVPSGAVSLGHDAVRSRPAAFIDDQAA